MSFYDRYELLEQVRDGAVKTFAALQKTTGLSVAVHLFAGGKQAHPQVFEVLDRAPDELRAEILDSGEHEGTPFVVTRPWSKHESFTEWVLSARRESRAPDSFVRPGSWRVPTAEFGKKSAPGEFTKMFQAGRPPDPETVPPASAGPIAFVPGATPPTPEPAAPRPPADPHPDTPPEPGTPVSKPGLFTSMFHADQIRALAERPPVAAPEPPSESGPGEFTRRFAVGKPGAPEPAHSQTAASNSQGEFTRQFRLDTNSVTPPATVADQSPNQQGEFTRMFQAIRPEAPPSRPQAAEPSITEAGPAIAPEAFVRRDVELPASAPSSARDPEPGEFTRIFRTAPTAPSKPPAGPTMPGGAPGRFYKALRRCTACNSDGRTCGACSFRSQSGAGAPRREA